MAFVYATDSARYSAVMQRAQIDHAAWTDPDKRKLFRKNAARLLKLPRRRAAASPGSKGCEIQ